MRILDAVFQWLSCRHKRTIIAVNEKEGKKEKMRNLHQKSQEIKEKFKHRLEMPNDHQESSSSGQGENEGKVEAVYWKSIHKRPKDGGKPWGRALWERTINSRSEMISSLNTLGRKKSPGVSGILTGSFQATKTESVEILTRICQQMWKTEQWTTGWTHPTYTPIVKKGGAKEGSDCMTTALMSRASEVMLKTMQQSLLFFLFY